MFSKLPVLDKIGFYTLTENRVKDVSINSPMWRTELILTDKCNFSCPYCRGLKKELHGDISIDQAKKIIDLWSMTGLKNIRFSGGEPIFYPNLIELVKYTKNKNVERIAISSNGSGELNFYKQLINAGVNDFSISLDACCSSFGQKMCGVRNAWEEIVYNIKELSKLTYVTVGIVIVEETVQTLRDLIVFSDSLGVSDIRIISSAQYNVVLNNIKEIPVEIIQKYPILKYRINNYLNGRNVRGISANDSCKCALVLDDSAICGNYHFPCIIYLREGGKPIGKISDNMRIERQKWFVNHNSHNDSICSKNCLDVCIDYNNKYRDYH